MSRYGTPRREHSGGVRPAQSSTSKGSPNPVPSNVPIHPGWLLAVVVLILARGLAVAAPAGGRDAGLFVLCSCSLARVIRAMAGR